jgi:ERCC4-type nuclease
MSLKEITIVCDVREKSSKIDLSLKDLSSKDIKVNIIFEQLKVGDFQISQDIVIERKTIKDLESSIIDGRIFNQIKDLVNIKRSSIIIEGDLNKLFSQNQRINKKAIIGLLTSIGINYRIPIFFTKDIFETAIFLYTIAKKEQIINKNKDLKLRYNKTKMSGSDFQLFIMQSFPDVGPTLAKSILKEFKSIKNISNASVQDLLKVSKLGPKKAQKIKYLFEREY